MLIERFTDFKLLIEQNISKSNSYIKSCFNIWQSCIYMFSFYAFLVPMSLVKTYIFIVSKKTDNHIRKITYDPYLYNVYRCD